MPPSGDAPGLTLVVLAAGRGTRFGGFKQAAAVGPARELLLDFALFDARRAGFTSAAVVVPPGAELGFREHCSAVPPDFTVHVVPQRTDLVPADVESAPREAPWGTGHAVLAARHVIGPAPFAVVNADDFYGREAYARAAAAARARAGTATLVAMRLADTLSPHGPVTRAVCEVDRGRVVRLDEVGGLARRGPSIVAGDGRVLDPDTLVSMNFWVLPAFVLERLAVAFSAFAARPDTAAREFLLPAAISELVAAGGLAVDLAVSPGPWFGLTHAADHAGVVASLERLTADGTYPTPLWPVVSRKP